MPEIFHTAQLSVHINRQVKTVQEIHMYLKHGGCVKKLRNFVTKKLKNFVTDLIIFIYKP